MNFHKQRAITPEGIMRYGPLFFLFLNQNSSFEHPKHMLKLMGKNIYTLFLKKILLVQKKRLAYNFLCLNNLLFLKQNETRYQLSCKQCRSRSAGGFRSTRFFLQHKFIIMNQNMNATSKWFLTCPEYSGTRSDKLGIVFPHPYICLCYKGTTLQ